MFTPEETVRELDRYIVGQGDAKKAVALALRNRWRRKKLPESIREEIVPKNILMIGPTGVGKTEMARRLAKLSQAPFIKVEATKFTEVGYVGRDVEQIIRDLMELSLKITRDQMKKDVLAKAYINATNKVIDALVGKDATFETREKFLEKLKNGILDDKEIEIKVLEQQSSLSSIEIPGLGGSHVGMLSMGDMLGKAFGQQKSKLKKLKVQDALKYLLEEESDKLLDQDKAIDMARENVEQNGIVFIDEIDKICGTQSRGQSGEVSREGVQRDLLPLIEGTSVSTKYGVIKTDYILFIASGAFHLAAPSDLLPELQGRLPNRVELKALVKDDFVKILTEPEASLIKQYKALLSTEGVTLDFREDGIETIAQMAFDVNQNIENIGARRLHTILEKLLEDVSFNASKLEGEKIIINADYVQKSVGNLAKDIDLSKFIL